MSISHFDPDLVPLHSKLIIRGSRRYSAGQIAEAVWLTTFRPGWKMYQVVWERDGERLATHALHAADEADARSRAEASLAKHPEHDFDRTGTTVRVRAIAFPLSLDDDY
jgi:hypothetical protein